MSNVQAISKIANNIQRSPIPVLAAEISERKRGGESLFNLTVGDFDPNIFPIPSRLRDQIIEAYRQGHTNYPGAKGMIGLRESVCELLEVKTGAKYSENEVLIASGSRPLIYSAYLALVDPGDKVVFPAPSWNNNYYAGLSGAQEVIVQTTAENDFMPTASDFEPHIKEATLIALCSPLNPTGTVLDAKTLKEICALILAENKAREGKRKPVYLMMDQVYWLLAFDGKKVDIVTALCPEMKPYTILSDGVSKAFAGTGIRVGWAYGPAEIIQKMRTLVSHMGAWAPKAEQVAVGAFLNDTESVDAFLDVMCKKVKSRLDAFYNGFCALADKQYPINAIEPLSSIYLSVEIKLRGKVTADGKMLETTDDVHRFLLNHAKTGLLPFSYFGTDDHPDWYRLSVGTVNEADIANCLASIETAMAQLN